MPITPTIVTVPCFSGAPWELEQLQPLAPFPLRTMRLPDRIDAIERYADYVADQVSDLSDYVVVGDSFGAVVALALAVRQPPGLRALVLSGGFAANPVTDPATKAKVAAAKYLPGLLYRHLVLRAHAASLASPFDREGQVPWTRVDSRRLFIDHTPHASYVARAHAAFTADYTGKIGSIPVPTLILTPAHDTLIGEGAARILREGIPDATEVVLPRTGHMFRFTHPHDYATAVRDFLTERGVVDEQISAAAIK